MVKKPWRVCNYLFLSLVLGSCATAPGKIAQDRKPLAEAREIEFDSAQVQVSDSKPINGSLILVNVELKPGQEGNIPFGKIGNTPFFFYAVGLNRPHSFQATVAVSYGFKPGKQDLAIALNDEMKAPVHVALQIQDGKYPLAPKKMNVPSNRMNPSREEAERTESERARVRSLFEHPTLTRFWHEAFILPLQADILSEFGRRRKYVDPVLKLKRKSNPHQVDYVIKSHLGTDIRARTPLPIVASGSGKVALAEELFQSGGTVILDHGFGLYTLYFHLSRIDVKVGEEIKLGQEIGLTGATGRVEGPHLHWGAVANGEYFNPRDLTKVKL